MNLKYSRLFKVNIYSKERASTHSTVAEGNELACSPSFCRNRSILCSLWLFANRWIPTIFPANLNWAIKIQKFIVFFVPFDFSAVYLFCGGSRAAGTGPAAVLVSASTRIVTTAHWHVVANLDNSSRTNWGIETCAIIENLYCSVRESWKNGGQKWY